MSVGQALDALGIINWRLTGEPTNETEFKAQFIKFTGKDSNDVVIESTNPDDFGVTWAQIQESSTQLKVTLTELRQERNHRLAETDWWAVSDRTMTADQTAYRKKLRDITDTYTSLSDVVWPTKP